jgi:hypothetical protein
MTVVYDCVFLPYMEYVFKTGKAYKINPEVVIIVTVLQDWKQIITAGYMNIVVLNCSAVI